MVDNNLYDRVLRDSRQEPTNSIIYLGPDHKLQPFRVTPLLHVDWLDVAKGPNGEVSVQGTLPYFEGRNDANGMKDTLTKFLQSGSLEVAVNLEFRPRQQT